MAASLTRAGAREPTEKQIHAAVISHWRTFGQPGTFVATIPNMGAMGQYGLTAGLPDLMVLSPRFGVRFIELKTHTGVLSIAQKKFLERCAEAGVNCAVTRGRDEPVAMLEQWGVVRPRSAVGTPA